jgi:hypothetical protein
MHPHGERFTAHHGALRFLGGWSRILFFEEDERLEE